MNVLFFARALGPGGAERQMALMAAGLQRRGHNVAVATFYPDGAFRQTVLDAGVRHVSLEKGGRWDVVGFLLRLRRLLEQDRPEILYSLLPPANIIAAIATPRIPGMRRIWGIRVSDMDLSYYDWLQRLSYALEFRLARFADLVVFNSHSGYRRAMARGMPMTRSAIIPNGIDTDIFTPDDATRLGIRNTWGISDGERVIGMIGRFDPMKDHGNFLAAAAKVLQSRPRTWFALAGRGVTADNVNLADLVRAVGLSDRVLLLGERRDMPEVMRGLDVLCLPSAFGEGFPNVLGEAMAVGTPCVSTDVGDCREIVGDTGEIVSPRDPTALAAAMERMLACLEQSPVDVRNRSRARIVETYAIDALVDRTEALLEGLVRPVRSDADGT